MFKVLFYGHLGITVLLIYSWTSLFFLAPNARDARLSNKKQTARVMIAFVAMAVLAAYLKFTGHVYPAFLILAGFYGLILCWILWLLKKTNWQ